ncbi:Uu.00g065240.m01.CDS01 [Anthostomella pinea]|uniref:Uu.00g065240.m01.CDS01 n=1 Tax=Anthostomella pinea TaxID=933095 RepID=A0AAI8VTS1_9PEZI|nr:Uu.00g065240.m01.CDS01 [Anthostomella pinea]
MKLIVAGATGFVGKEVIRQSLSRHEITSVVAVARKPVSAPDNLDAGADPSKLRSVVVRDYDDYSEEVKRDFADAGACIWTVAVTPTKSRAYDFEEVKRICQTSALTGLRAMHDAGPAKPKPFRFLYMSGAMVEREPAKKPWFMPEYSLMRGETETEVLALATELGGVEAACVRPGLIVAPGEIMKSVVSSVLGGLTGIPSIALGDLTAVMLDQVIEGFEKEPLMPRDLARLVKER